MDIYDQGQCRPKKCFRGNNVLIHGAAQCKKPNSEEKMDKNGDCVT